MEILKWLKIKLSIWLLAMSRVEKDAFSQKLSTDNGHTITDETTQRSAVDNLIRGEITQEVRN